MKLLVEFTLFIVLAIYAFGFAETSNSFLNETEQQINERMKWWRQDRFGMFIHWGLYAVPAGEWNNETNHAEWIRTTAQIPRDEYDKFLGQFNPVKFDADKWVKMARNAGMKYIVITSKHHDGFCLWNSDTTDFDVVEGTPFKRDILKELSEACIKNDMKMCFYHSIMDWHHPDYLPRRGWEKWPAGNADYQKYIVYMKAQLKELINQYNPHLIWFDGEWESTWTHEMGLDLYNYVRSLDPDIIINNRVDKGRQGMQGMTKDDTFAGDFGTPEQEIPSTGIPGIDWESCMTMNGHWGWNKNDKNFKSTTDLVRKLVDIASKGGNYLLNIGPKPDGTFPQESIDRLKEIGKWMNIYGDSIYGTSASPFQKLVWGRCTQKISGNKTSLYLHVFHWPANGILHVPGLQNKIDRAYMLSDSKNISFNKSENGIELSLPDMSDNTIDSVIVLEITEPLKIERVLPTQNADGKVTLSAIEAEINNEQSSDHARIEEKIDDISNIGFWIDQKTTVLWKFKIKQADKFIIRADIATASPHSSFNIKIRNNTYSSNVISTDSYENFKLQELCRTGKLLPGEYSLEIIPDDQNWSPINIRSIVLEHYK